MGDSKRKGCSTIGPEFVPLGLEQRTHVDTASAAYHFGRKPQTMRVWASTERGNLDGMDQWVVASQTTP
jgi:hypothetical protein